MKKASLLLALTLAGWMSAPTAWAHHGGGSLSGTFASSDGTTGTYVETRTTSGTTVTDTVVFTTTDLSQTGTDTTATTLNTDGSKTVVYTHTALGATVPSILSITYPVATTTTTPISAVSSDLILLLGPGSPGGPGGFGLSLSVYGTGSLTSAAGALATLSAFQTNVGNTTVTSIDFTTTLLNLSRELRVVSTDGPIKVITTIDVDLTGVATTEILTLVAASSKHHH